MLLCSAHCRAAIELEVVLGERLQAAQGGVEKPYRAAQRAALAVVIRGRELDQTLIEVDELAFGREPQRLPRFMRFPKLRGVEVSNALRECRRQNAECRTLRSTFSAGVLILTQTCKFEFRRVVLIEETAIATNSFGSPCSGAELLAIIVPASVKSSIQ